MTVEQQQVGLSNRIVLAHAELWLKQYKLEHPKAEMPDVAYKIQTAGYNSRVINGFSDNEAKLLMAMADDADFKPIKDKPVSLLIMALETMSIWVREIPRDQRTPRPNISEKKLLLGKQAYVMYLIKLKKSIDKEHQDAYEEQKDVIDETAKHCQVWFDFVKEYVEKHLETT